MNPDLLQEHEINGRVAKGSKYCINIRKNHLRRLFQGLDNCVWTISLGKKPFVFSLKKFFIHWIRKTIIIKMTLGKFLDLKQLSCYEL